MSDLRVGVVRGGTGPEYHVSLATGARVLGTMPAGYKPVDIWISKDGLWHVGGIPVRPEEAIRHTDVIFNALHESHHEDKTLGNLAKDFNIPHAGSDTFSGALAANKVLSRDYFRKHGIDIPRGRYARGKAEIEEVAFQVFNLFSPPWVVKPARGGSSFGVRLCHTYQELLKAMQDALAFDDLVLVEEFVEGREVTCCVVELADGKHRTLPVLEIEKAPHKKIFDHATKYETGDYRLRVDSLPSNISNEASRTALRGHEALGLSRYSRADMIVRPNGKVVLLEVNSRPALGPLAIFPKALEVVSFSFNEFLEHLLLLARNARRPYSS
jgi:D-alanine-D-alanine ligase